MSKMNEDLSWAIHYLTCDLMKTTIAAAQKSSVANDWASANIIERSIDSFVEDMKKKYGDL